MRGRKALPEDIQVKIVALIRKGFHCNDIAAKLGISDWTVRKYAKVHGLKIAHPDPQSKVPKHIQEQIFSLLKQKVPYREIAKLTGFSASTVRKYAGKLGIKEPMKLSGGVPMEKVLSQEECERVKLFFRALLTGHRQAKERGIRFDVGEVMQAWREVSKSYRIRPG